MSLQMWWPSFLPILYSQPGNYARRGKLVNQNTNDLRDAIRKFDNDFCTGVNSIGRHGHSSPSKQTGLQSYSHCSCLSDDLYVTK